MTALQTRLVRGRVTLVPLMAAALARAFPDEAANDPATIGRVRAEVAKLTAKFPVYG
jgi:hypothetical protein